MTFTWPGHLTVTLRTGEALEHVPSQLDVVLGAGRAVSRLDRGPLDKAIQKWGGGARTACVYASRYGLGRPGEHHLHFDELEENLGISRTYRLEIADPERSTDVRNALRDLAIVEAAAIQTLATTPAAAPAMAKPAGFDEHDAAEPYERIRIPEAHALEQNDEDVTVGVVDTGVSLGHPELQRKCLAGYNTVDLGIGSLSDGLELVGDSWGPDFNPVDYVGHGSMVAGILGAQGWRIPKGVAGRALLLPIRVLAAARREPHGTRFGVGANTDIDAGCKAAVDLGAEVLNMSFGTPTSALAQGDPPPHRRVIDYAMHYGCTLVAAAGNKGDREQYYPAAWPEVIAVGSVDARDQRSAFSSYGPHLAVCAPGEDIWGLARRGYRVGSGTSFASPFVSGVAALMVGRARKHGHEVNGVLVKQILTETARPLARDGFSEETGHGLVDALAALRRLDAWLESRRRN